MSNVDGTERVHILDELIPHPFGFTLLGDHLYWTDWQDRSIERANKVTGEDQEVLVSGRYIVMGVKAAMVCPDPAVTTPCARAPCSHLCLMTPQALQGAVGAWPRGSYRLTQDNRTCGV